MLQRSGHSAVGLPRAAPAHPAEKSGAAGKRPNGADFLAGGPGHHYRQAATAQGRKGTGIRSVLLRLPQAAAAVSTAPSPAIWFSQLLHGVQRLLYRHGDGLATQLRPDGGSRHGKYPLRLDLEQQSVLQQYNNSPSSHGRPGTGRQVHCGGPPPFPDCFTCRHPSASTARH